jgi:hypothetical protein
MEKDFLLRAREYITHIDELEGSPEDKLELMSNLWLLLDPDNYDEHMSVLMRNCNDSLKWKAKGKFNG